MIARRSLLAGFVALATVGSAFAQDYPERTITLIVPFAPGGVTDVSARLIADQMSRSLGQTVVVENRSGGGGTLGATVAAQAAPNGYTLFFASSGTFGIIPAMHKTLDYDPVKSFDPVGQVATAPYLLIVRSDLPVKTVRELAEYIKANPGKVNFGSPTGTPVQVLANLFKAATDGDVAIVPYRGGAPAMADLMSGQVHVMFQPTSTILPIADDKRIRILAIAQEERSPLIPDVPTMAEAGFPQFIAESWNGVVAPQGTPQPIIERLNKAVNEGLRSEKLKAAFAKLGVEASIVSPDQFAGFIRKQAKRWAGMVQDAGLKKID